MEVNSSIEGLGLLLAPPHLYECTWTMTPGNWGAAGQPPVPDSPLYHLPRTLGSALWARRRKGRSMRFNPRDRLLLAAFLCGLLVCASVALSRDLGPRGAPIPEARLALLRGVGTSSQLTTSWCDQLPGNYLPNVSAHGGCVTPGTVCVLCSIFSNPPSKLSGTGYDPGAQISCKAAQQDRQFGLCNNQLNCAHYAAPTGFCGGNVQGNQPEGPDTPR